MTGAATGFFWHERCFWHDPGAIGVFSAPGEFLQPQPASESPESKRRLKNLLEVSGLIDELAVCKPPPASREDLERFHTTRYLDALAAGDAGRGGDGGDCAPYLPGSMAAASQSAGLAVGAVEAVATGELSQAYALCRPPGHHAEADRGRGFCLLGNIPVAVMRARALGQVGRVAILDWDVHHGNGQQGAFWNTPEVLTISLHQAGNYPLETGEFAEQGGAAALGTDLNLPLPPGCGIGAYEYAMDTLVLPAIEAFAPELIVVACGYDACAKDPLGKMLLNTAVKAGFDETIMLDPEGYVAEASAANVFLVRDGVLHTPEVTSCLQGITRDSVIRLAREGLGLEVVERRITRDELYIADEAFLTGTAAEILPLRELDGRHIGARIGGPAVGAPIADGSVTARLQSLYRRLVRGELEADLAAFGAWLTPV